MDWWLWFSLLLTCLPVTETMKEIEGCLSQPNTVIWRKTGQSAVLPCNVNSQCSAKDLRYEWFAFKENACLRLNVLDNHLKYKLEGGSLHIKSLNANDSGIYHCAATSPSITAPSSQHVGLGTTLVVKEVKMMVRHILLWLSLVLLAIYSLAVVTLIIKKHDCITDRRMQKTEKINSTKRRQFHDVLQEMYKRGNKKTVSRSRSHVEAATPEFNSSTDDIYQNVQASVKDI
ncbi:immunoglobulin superfamily member 6 [Pempheris klunzingeri]|uniref:immunoglobulin superfamily member 6 n=1 Tax=Pempheris klunzingeri TaxID=3127111 RepID=UPI0039811BAC